MQTDEQIGGRRFDLIGAFHLQTDSAGQIVEYTHQLPVGIRANLHAAGPFCNFKFKGLPATSGVYAVKMNNDFRYVGLCVNLRNRFGSRGYGSIAPRNCHHDGQATNCKINALILSQAKAGHAISLYFHETPDYKQVEKELINLLKTPWNGRQRS